MNLQFYHMMNIFLASRLFFFIKDKPQTIRAPIIMTLALIIGLLFFKINPALMLLIFSTVLLTFIFYFLERNSSALYELRLISLLIFAVLFSIFFSDSVNVSFNPMLLELSGTLRNYSLLFDPLTGAIWLRVSIIMMGVLLILNEVNIFIRYIFKSLNLMPGKMKDNVINIDTKEYNAGRFIGILERSIIYIAVLNNHFSVIAFILAAKGFTRFKELDERRFAEYVLIGTLLSSLLAILVAGAVRTLLRFSQ